MTLLVLDASADFTPVSKLAPEVEPVVESVQPIFRNRHLPVQHFDIARFGEYVRVEEESRGIGKR